MQRLEGDGLIVRDAVNLGIAVDLDHAWGSVVPARFWRRRAQLTVVGLATAISDDRHRQGRGGGQLAMTDLENGTYSISNNRQLARRSPPRSSTLPRLPSSPWMR